MINEVIKKNGITYGIVAGVVSVLITSIIYSTDIKLFTAWWVTIMSLVIYIALSITLIVKTKKEINSFFSFKDTFTTYFIFAVIAILISAVFNIILFNFIDPPLKETIKEMTLKYMADMMQKMDAPAAKINEALQKIKDSDQLSIGGILKGSASNLLVSSIFGLILAAFFKSKSTQE
ncbi:DUF4199 domain-containing protein [Flavobacterium sharifuzzamanii]|uniref:DUF4199 domain-containing protein n=1 Tax=Flavobacterium sharifuzzamanii TaxID=2211133 RepID=UPI000DAF121B|nr:DUF4199 domain-containing protein [Flavobacterium sharifuzzamanii]KAF2081356.1 DUF4199 domain-containing protein [Flavobacterium sharifuzzamanii]